jgi:cytochrome c
LRSANLIWTPRALDTWLASPESFLPGNDMAFAGYSSATDRRDLIAFLLHKTGGVAE